MATFRPYKAGLFQLDTPAGPLPVSATADQLIEAGHTPDPGPRLALNGAGGQGGVPESRADVTPSLGGPGSGAGGSPAQKYDQDVVDGAPSSPSMQPKNESTTDMTRETKPVPEADASEKAKKGPKETELTVSVPDPRGKLVPAQDVRAAYTTESHGAPLNKYEQRAREIDEQRIVDAETNKAGRAAVKLQAQNELEDINFRGQEKALDDRAQQLERWKTEYKARQEMLDRGHAEADAMQVDPKKIFHDKGGTWAAIGAAIQMIAGGARAGLQHLGYNPGEESVRKDINESVERQKDQIARKREGLKGQETELERRIKMLGDPEVAEASLKSDMMALATAKAKAMGRDAPEDYKANLDQFVAEREKQQIDERQAIRDAHAPSIKEMYKNVPAHHAGGSGGALTPKQKEQLGVLDAGDLAIKRQIALEKKHGNPDILNSGWGGSSASKELAAGYDSLASQVATALEGKPSPRTNEATRKHYDSIDGQRRMDALLSDQRAIQTKKDIIMQGGDPYAGAGGGDSGGGDE